MDAGDRTEIRQMLSDVLSGHAEEMNGRFNVQHVQLLAIEKEVASVKEQVTKANGRTAKIESKVNDLEIDSLKHYSDCPNVDRIRILEDDKISRKAIMSFLFGAATLAGIIGGLLISAFNYIRNV